MNREQFARAIRTACAYLEEPYVVVFGSQSILGSYDDSTLPAEASMSREVDISPGSAFTVGTDLDDKLSVLDVFVGEDSPFHDLHGVYVEGIHKDTVVLPNGWENRLVHFTADDGSGAEYGRTGLCLDPVDLCAAKTIAGRTKDHEFVSALIRDGIIHATDVLDRIASAGIQWPAVYTDDRELALIRATNWLESFLVSAEPAFGAGQSASESSTEDYSAVLDGLSATPTGDDHDVTGHELDRNHGPDLEH
ncbi:hypothetical protein MYP14_24995 (plasmid) [Rhodococcus pyridinivorans]|uniref:hypothetical protein n=1 Tax=Rhodococcus pyridinivorans TaxID=103816 RepID=UPI001FFEF1A2|nr:hypothetical protein [Rhodococcus pyridinivorans]UPK66486.1 hypothetical protein MYP14_24995 [Rhodococcus pyridinivorans]